MSQTRRLAAILAADVAGYSRLMRADEEGTLERLKALRHELINLGDVIVDCDDLYGDGVNIAARIEALAEAGGVLVSNTVYDHVRDRLPFVFEDLGEQQVKNIARPVRVYRVRPQSPLPNRPPLAGEGSARSAGVGLPSRRCPSPTDRQSPCCRSLV